MIKIKNKFLVITFIIFPFLFMHCSTGKLVTAPQSVLKKYQIIAVAPLEIIVNTKKGKGVKIVTSLVNTNKKNKKALSFIEEVLGKDVIDVNKFQDFLADSLNRNFMQKGFVPIERTRLKAVFKEIGLQQSGAIDSSQAKKFGKLASADAIFLGKVMIDIEKRFIGNKINLYLSGRLVSVKEGFVLISGSSSTKVKEVNLKNFSELIDKWFRSLRRISK
jgi:hypothetical protein